MNDDIKELIASHRFFTHLKPEYIEAMAECASLKTYKTGDALGREGATSEFFFALLEGRVAIESYQPGHDPVTLQTIHGGEIVGWSWLFPPYEWVFDAKAISDVRSIAFDTSSLREICEKNPALGFELMKRFAQVMTMRLKATRLQLLDMYNRKTGHRAKGQDDD
jgi:CRP-like cAMP-binding protein